MAKVGMEIKGSLAPLVDLLTNLPKKRTQTATRWMQLVTFHAAERSELNAPIKTGLLRDTIRPMMIYGTQSSVRGGVEAMVFYAKIRHDDYYNLGKISAQQPKTVEGRGHGSGPGRMYIYNVLIYHNQKYLGMLDSMFKAMLSGKDMSHGASVLQPTNLWHAQSGEGE